MALLDDLTKGAAPGNLALGVGAALLAPLLAPAVSSVLRPAAKAVVRTGITLYRGAMEPVSAALGNLVAEAQMELATVSAATVPAAQVPAAQADGAPRMAAGAAGPPHPHRRRSPHP